MNQGKGFAVSILAHLLIVVVLLYATSQIQVAPKLMVVDFTILESPVQTKTSPKITKQQVAPAPPVVKPPEKIMPPPPPKPLPRQKVAKKIVKPVPLQKSKIAAIKPKPVPPPEPKLVPPPEPKLVPPPEPDPIQTAEIAPAAEIPTPTPPQLEKAATLLVDNSTPATRDAASTLKPLINLPAPSAGKSLADTDQSKVSKYTKAQFSHIQKGIQRQINYPRIARKMGWEGKVVVEFIICKDGTVKNISIVESSGIKALDKNAVATIKKAAPFPIPPIPAKLIIPVLYRLS